MDIDSSDLGDRRPAPYRSALPDTPTGSHRMPIILGTIPPFVGSQACSACSKKLGVFSSPKQHCHHCGLTYCIPCTESQVLAPRPETHAWITVNVCRECYNLLKITCASPEELRRVPARSLQGYLASYALRSPGDALEKSDLIRAILDARDRTGAIPPENERQWRIRRDWIATTARPLQRGSENAPRGPVYNGPGGPAIFGLGNAGPSSARPPAAGGQSAPPRQPGAGGDWNKFQRDMNTFGSNIASDMGGWSGKMAAWGEKMSAWSQRMGRDEEGDEPPPYSAQQPPVSAYQGRGRRRHNRRNQTEEDGSSDWEGGNCDDSDVFTDRPAEQNPRQAEGSARTARGQGRAARPAPAPAPAAARPDAIPTLSDLARPGAPTPESLPLRALRGILTAAQVDFHTIVEKQELITLVERLVAQESNRTSGAAAADPRASAASAASAASSCTATSNRRSSTARQSQSQNQNQASSSSVQSAGATAGKCKSGSGNKGGKEGRSGECLVCLDEEADYASIDCGHCAMCRTCADRVLQTTRQCVVCRKPIRQGILRIYRP